MSSLPLCVFADFLDEASVEASVLEGVARIQLAGAHSEEDLAEILPHADIVILYHDIAMLTDASFARAPRCQAVIRAGVGYNNVDIVAAGARGIAVCNVPDYGTEEVADHAIMLLLAVARRLRQSDVSIRNGEWDFKVAQAAPRLRGKTLGIVGCGRIGTATALRGKALGLDVLIYDPLIPPGVEKAIGVRRTFDLEELLEQSHYVSLHCYLDASTHHLIDRKALGRMRPGSILVNTARGPVVEQEALVDALESGHLLGAGIDVFEREPFDDERLRQNPNVLLTPHSAFYSIEGFVELRSKAAEEARRMFRGERPRNLVNRAVLVDPRCPAL